ncbi:MAG: ABC transporter ATP-binding protein [Verrucomicrobia bacterium]|jgi:lipoprotein-releasing system ATP-binding protein|nr:ABC transporter ATP-binding protein [Verrucomicrobiota bacterium]
MTKPMLSLAEITKHYDSGAGKVEVLARVNLTLAAGESLAIVGPSGCGKSTLLNIIGTLDRPSGGRIELDGRDLTGLDEVAMAGVRNRELGFVFQSHHLLPQCTVLENVLVPTLPLADVALRDSAPGRARQLLEKVGLGGRLGHRPGQLSGGERQRVAVVRALINRPKLLLADEPTGALDRSSAANLGELLVRLNAEEGVSLIVVTHALELAKQMKRVFELRDGALHELVDSH